MQIQGEVTYNGETFDKFMPQRTAAYIAQVSRPAILWSRLLGSHVPCLALVKRSPGEARIHSKAKDFLTQDVSHCCRRTLPLQN